MLQPLSSQFVDTVLRPQIRKDAARRLDSTATAQGIKLDSTQTLVDVIVDVVMDGGELEPVSEAGRLAASVVQDILADARGRMSNDWMLDILLYHRLLYGEEAEIPKAALQTVQWYQNRPRGGRRRGNGGASRPKTGLKRARLP